MEEENKKNGFFLPAGIVRDDRILPEARWLAVLAADTRVSPHGYES